MAAQDPSQSWPGTARPATGPPVKEYEISCGSVSGAEEGCKSFNEMVKAKDADLISLLENGTAYVCFRVGEDVFSVVPVVVPPDWTFKKVPPKGPYKSDDLFFYSRYKNGQSDDDRVASGGWRKFGPKSEPHYSTEAKSDIAATITGSEVALNYSYKNVAGGTTTYSLQIRRSTLRGSESLQWHNPPTDKKSQSDSGTVDYDDRCVIFQEQPSEVPSR